MKLSQIFRILRVTASAVLVVSVFSCKASKNVLASGEANDMLSAKQVIKQHQKKDTDFKTMQARIRIDIAQGEQAQGATFNCRIEKDKVIWLSAPIGIARMMITPEKVRFYNKGDNTFFDGDYNLLSDFVGVDLDFMKVQNILLGQAVYNLKAEPHEVSINGSSYALSPKDQNVLIELFYLINPSHFKMDSLQLHQQLKKRMLQVDYSSYQEIDKQILPQHIRIIAVDDTDQVAITMEFKSVSLNEDVRFPFKIPSGYKEIIIK